MSAEVVPPQPFRFEMPKRHRAGVWRDSPSSEDATHSMSDFEMVSDGNEQLVLATASAPEQCPYPACLQCMWGLAVADHTNYQAIIGRYEEKIAQLQTSTSLSPDEKCSQCVILNHHLMTMERALYDKKHLGEEQVLAKMTTLRTTPRENAPWGMIGQPASTHGAVASFAAAADGAPAADADDGDSDAKR